MRTKIMAVSTANKAINKARSTGKLSLVAVAKLNLFRYCMEFALKQIALGKEEYKDKYELLASKFNNLANSCPDIICNIREASCSSGEYESNSSGNVSNPYNPVAPSTPSEPEPEPSNEPPTIGDNAITVDRNVNTTLTIEMFTTDTTAPYSDPEGDLIDAIRIDKIHSTNQGVFYVLGVPISEGQIITREQIIAEELYHIGADVQTITSDSFDFSARDEGSGIWVN